MSFMFGEVTAPRTDEKVDRLAKGFSHIKRVDVRSTATGTHSATIFDTSDPCALLGFDYTTTRDIARIRIEPRDDAGVLMSELQFPQAWESGGGLLRFTALRDVVDADGWGPFGMRLMRDVAGSPGEFWLQWWPKVPLYCPTGLQLRNTGHSSLSEWTFHFVGLVAFYAEDN